MPDVPVMSKRLTLAEQIAQLQDVAPTDFDPEADDGDRSDPEAPPSSEDDRELADNDAARAHYLDVGPSALRKLHDSIADPKYDGLKTSRKALLDDDEVSYDSDAASEESENENDDDEHEKEVDSPDEEMPIENSLASSMARTRDAERKKGKAVKRQLVIWDTLVDARIRMQKVVTATNLLPMPEKLPLFIEDEEGRFAVQQMLEEASKLSEDLFELREALLAQAEGVTLPPRKKRKLESADELEVAYEALVIESSEEAANIKHAYHPFLLTTLNKWSSKIQAVAPNILMPSNRNAFRSARNEPLKSVTQLIDESLADTQKVLGRTRVPRGPSTARMGTGTRIGDQDAMDLDGNLKEDEQVFDDTDFYQQLLKDIIESRGGVSGMAAEDWVSTTSKKVKKKVDTKASKGRKLRYEVHEKLQHFMVPIPPSGNAWHDEQIDELFASLLGKGFEAAGDGYDPVDGVDTSMNPGTGSTNDLPVYQVKEALTTGFRVFG